MFNTYSLWCVHMFMQASTRVRRSEDNCGHQLSSSTVQVLGTELRQSRLGHKCLITKPFHRPHYLSNMQTKAVTEGTARHLTSHYFRVAWGRAVFEILGRLVSPSSQPLHRSSPAFQSEYTVRNLGSELVHHSLVREGRSEQSAEVCLLMGPFGALVLPPRASSTCGAYVCKFFQGTIIPGSCAWR